MHKSNDEKENSKFISQNKEDKTNPSRLKKCGLDNRRTEDLNLDAERDETRFECEKAEVDFPTAEQSCSSKTRFRSGNTPVRTINYN